MDFATSPNGVRLTSPELPGSPLVHMPFGSAQTGPVESRFNRVLLECDCVTYSKAMAAASAAIKDGDYQLALFLFRTARTLLEWTYNAAVGRLEQIERYVLRLQYQLNSLNRVSSTEHTNSAIFPAQLDSAETEPVESRFNRVLSDYGYLDYSKAMVASSNAILDGDYELGLFLLETGRSLADRNYVGGLERLQKQVLRLNNRRPSPPF
jgi:sulfur relay (sulfurtransferase) complex TusBCD TusD component (DsrE family)